MKKTVEIANLFILKIKKNHTGAYAAQSAYFMVLSLVPCILLLLTLVQYTPITKADVMTAVVQVFPENINSLIVSIVNEVYNQSKSVIPLTAIVTIWSAARAVLSISGGLNCVYDCDETRNYILLRIRAALYTLLFLAAVVLSLLLLVFGNSISYFIDEHLPFWSNIVGLLVNLRVLLSVVVIVFVFMVVYRFLPNRKTKFLSQLPGALFVGLGWTITSYVFSIYVDVFKGFANMYGSLTTIILIMLWLYMGMYLVLIGAEMNVLVDGLKKENKEFLDKTTSYDKIEKDI